ncbi:MAG: hypothetical protein AAF404_09220 [Pseudomonadota bacterium]
MSECPAEIRKLLRAYNLLVATCDDQRALVGQVSRDWLKSESEHFLDLAQVPEGVLRTVRGREIVCDALMPDFDANAESVQFESLLLQIRTSAKRISSNCLAKLEPSIAAEVLLGVILKGVQKYGNRRRGATMIDDDLIIAAMIRDTPGMIDRYSAVLPGNRRVVSEQMIAELFGDAVVQHIGQLRQSYHLFLNAYVADQCNQLKLPRAHANVIAAIEVCRLRLIARAAGDEVLGNLPVRHKQEMDSHGIDCDGSFPERPYLQLYYLRTRMALSVQGVDYGALVEPIEQTLMMSVSDVLEDADKRRRLVGRRGKAVQDVHRNLPLVELFNASENYNSLETVHLAALEMMQYLEKGRRKSAATMIGHSLRIAAVAEQIFGPALEPSVATIAILHDVVEDGSRPVAGYDQSLNAIKNRFGGPLAAMVSELTDAESSVAAAEKAQATLNCEQLILPQQQYNYDRFTEMTLRATATDEPYTLAGIVTKLIDTAISQEEGLHDPDVMNGWWKHSGVRIYWSCRVRGKVTRPLLLKLAREVDKHQRDVSSLSAEMIEGLRRLIAYSVHASDRYAVQNLVILADEYQLCATQRDALIDYFFDAQICESRFSELISTELLLESRLLRSIEQGRVPSACYVTLYGKDDNDKPLFDPRTFLDYRAGALQRKALVEQLNLEPLLLTGINYSVGEIISLYDLRKAA